MKPKFPLISIYNKALDIIPSENNLMSATVYGVLKGTLDSVAFDKDGTKWKYGLIANKKIDSLLTKILAYTIYNPIIQVTPNWTESGKYSLEELKSSICTCIDRDDDILTQFVEPERLKKIINDSDSFMTIHKALSDYVFEVDEEELYKNENIK